MTDTLHLSYLRELGCHGGLPSAHTAHNEQHERRTLEVEGAEHAVARDEIVSEGSLAHYAEDGRLQLRLRNIQLVAVDQLLLDVQCNLDGGVVRHLRSKASAVRCKGEAQWSATFAAVSVRTSRKRLSTVAWRSSPSPSQTRTFTKSYWLLECRTRAGTCGASMGTRARTRRVFSRAPGEPRALAATRVGEEHDHSQLKARRRQALGSALHQRAQVARDQTTSRALLARAASWSLATAVCRRTKLAVRRVDDTAHSHPCTPSRAVTFAAAAVGLECAVSMATPPQASGVGPPPASPLPLTAVEAPATAQLTRRMCAPRHA